MSRSNACSSRRLSSELQRSWVHFAAIVGILSLTLLILPFSQLQGSLIAHSMIELVATLLALFVGAVAITRYFARRETLLLFLGVGFLGAALFDGQHSVLTSPWWLANKPLDDYWSWNPSRTFLAFELMFACWACKRQLRHDPQQIVNDSRVYANVAILTFISFLFAAFLPLPRRFLAGAILGRPDELLAGAVFAIATFGFLQLSERRPYTLARWLAFAAALSCAGQVLVLARSQQLFDGFFMVSHLIRIVSYLLVLIGLIVEFHELFLEVLRAEQAYRDQASRTQAILDGATDAIITIRADGAIESFNAAAERMFKYSAPLVIGKNVNLLMPSPYHEEHDQYLQNYLRTGVSKIIGTGREAVGRRSDGSTFPLLLAVSDLTLGDRRLFTGIVRDISDLKHAMQQLSSANAELAERAAQIEQFNFNLKRSNDELKQFAYVASHDLQEPLRKVTAFCQLLRDEYAERLDENARSYIQYAVDGSLRMKSLVRDLLTYARIETQGKPLEPVSADDACREAIENLTMAINEAAAEITQDKLPTVLADRAQLVRLFQNLIGNAIKYRAQSLPTVHISSRSHDDWIEFRVRDNGIGIDPQYHERIFVIFQRLHARDEYCGTGIGLAVCKRIVERAGGRIWVESAAGAGSQFCFTMPKVTCSSKPGVKTNDLRSATATAAAD